MTSRLRFTALAFVFLFAAGQAYGQGYPDRAVRLVVPYPPGGAADVLARLVAIPMGEAIKQPIVIDNKGGAGGNIAAEHVAKSAPDGYTLLFGNVAVFSINPTLYKQVPFDPIKDFAPISLVASVPQILIVHPSLPVNSVSELVQYVKARPGKINYGSGGVGSATQLAVEWLKSMAGIDMVHVPFKGSGPGLAALTAGQVSLMIENMPSALPFVRGGRVRALAVSTAKRSALAEQLPTIAESGFPGYDLSAWFGIQAPAGTPPAIVAQLNQAVVKSVQSPQIRERLATLGADPVTNSPEEFSAFIRSELPKWAKIIKVSGATAE
jgi:tripartite-type tricarboxylate transporter receptor subunit TctC